MVIPEVLIIFDDGFGGVQGSNGGALVLWGDVIVVRQGL